MISGGGGGGKIGPDKGRIPLFSHKLTALAVCILHMDMLYIMQTSSPL